MTKSRALSKEHNEEHVVNNKENNKCSIWGDILHNVKNDDTLRIGFQNINGLGYDKETCRADRIKDFIHTNKTK